MANEPYSTCFSGTNALHFKDLNISPGASSILNYHDYTTAFEHGDNLNRTYFIEHGNHHLDNDTLNNEFNLEYMTTATDDLKMDRLEIFPNPFTDFIAASSQNISLELELFENGSYGFKWT